MNNPRRKRVDPYYQQNESLKTGSKDILSRVQEYYQGGMVIDVGVNIGTFIECVLEVFPKASILGFEPVKRYYNYATRKFRRLPNVSIQRLALSDKAGMLSMHIAKANIGWNTLVSKMVDDDNAHQIEKVRAVRFDRYWKKKGFPYKGMGVDIIKIDVEGWEYKVLRGMHWFLKQYRPVIVCEVGWGCHHPHWNQELKEFEYLYSIGYDREVEEQIKKLDSTTDVVFRPAIGVER